MSLLDDLIDGGHAVGPFVDGKVVKSKSNECFRLTNPSTGQELPSIPSGCKDDVNCAVASSRQAFDNGWSQESQSVRKQVLGAFADLIVTNASVLDALDAEEMGKPIREVFGNANAAAALMRFYAEAVDKVVGDVYVSDSRSFVAQRRVPRGVVAAIVPWNFPTYVAVLKIAPALAAGNCVVLKPSELSSRSSMCLAHLARRAGIPAGVLNIVPGLGETVGQALGLHSDVDMLTFTGSTNVGRWMLQYAGQSNLKVVTAECGGKSPHVVFDDGVDIDAVGASVAKMLLTNQGQVCTIGSRLIVQRSIERDLLDCIVRQLQCIVIGDALNPDTTFGPVASAKQCAQVLRYLETAQDEGAEVVTGGGRVLADTGGYFVRPTVIRNVSPNDRLAQEEIFGPVLAVLTFDHEEQAVDIANQTDFGLAAYVWTADLSRGMRMIKRIRSSVCVNSTAPVGEGPGYASSSEPFGHSGIGAEGGLVGMETYLRRQRVWINHGEVSRRKDV